MTLYHLSICGNKFAFKELQDLTNFQSPDPVCLGYYMMLINQNDIPNIIEIDKNQAQEIATRIYPTFKQLYRRLSMTTEHKYSELNHHQQLILGYLFFHGLTKKNKVKKGILLYELSSRNSNMVAQCFLGLCYQSDGVTKDNKISTMFNFSAENKYAPGEYNLGKCYQYGQGVAQNLSEAIRYYKLSSQKGYNLAQNILGACYQIGIGVERDETQAFNYFKLATEQGNAQSQYNLGLCYERGLGTTLDLSKAIPLYIESATKGVSASVDKLNQLRSNEGSLGIIPSIDEQIESYNEKKNKTKRNMPLNQKDTIVSEETLDEDRKNEEDEEN